MMQLWVVGLLSVEGSFFTSNDNEMEEQWETKFIVNNYLEVE